jgi:hypothetical protein
MSALSLGALIGCSAEVEDEPTKRCAQDRDSALGEAFGGGGDGAGSEGGGGNFLIISPRSCPCVVVGGGNCLGS